MHILIKMKMMKMMKNLRNLSKLDFISIKTCLITLFIKTHLIRKILSKLNHQMKHFLHCNQVKVIENSSNKAQVQDRKRLMQIKNDSQPIFFSKSLQINVCFKIDKKVQLIIRIVLIQNQIMSNIFKPQTMTNKLELKNSFGLKSSFNESGKQFNLANKENKILTNRIQQYQVKPKQYCCLYHYLQGKHTKGITPCNNHVSLGVINPITTLTKQQIQIIKNANIQKIRQKQKQNTENICVEADPYEFNYHTHFVNEIEKRGSMPKQLIKPRVYVQKVYSRKDDRKGETFFYPSRQNKAEYKQVYRLYKLFAQKTQFKDERSLKQDIMRFARYNNIKTANLSSIDVNMRMDMTTISQYLFSKQQFLSYLMSHGMKEKQCQQFWQAAYNRDRFVIAQRSQASLSVIKNDFVSMKAFAYNFTKFYLEQEEYYKNMFSQSGLRQRLIDLRLILQPWFSKNIVLKYKLKKWKKNEFQLAQFLKTSGYQKQYDMMIKLINQRNRLYTLMRTLAKSMFDLTDQKNIGMDIWNDRVTYIIEQKSDSLICFMQFIEKFKTHLIEQQLQNQQKSNQNIEITQILEYLNENKNQYTQLQQKWIINWVKNIYKYLFYYKDHQLIYLDQKTMKISCKSSVFIQKQLISQFIKFKSKQNDQFVDVLQNVSEEIQQKMQGMPQLQGKKQYLVQCNYLAQTLLRIIKKNDFSPFQTLQKFNTILEQHWFDFQNCYQQIVNLLRESYLQSESLKISPNQKFFKQLFLLEQNKKLLDLTKSQNNSLTQPYTYVDALNKYENVKKALGIQKPTINQIQITSVQRKKKPQKVHKNVKNLPRKAEQLLQKTQRNRDQVKQKINGFDWNLSQKKHSQQSCGKGYCIHCEDVISTQVSSTISKVQNMADYLSDLLRDIS